MNKPTESPLLDLSFTGHGDNTNTKNRQNESHSKATFLYATSRALERASYYGLRSLIVLYMITGTLEMEKSDALSIYGWFTGSFLLSQIIGAILGDLLIGNKRAIILGGILQSLGAFSFCVPSDAGLYLGLFLVAVGGGLYTPNIISNFGKLYKRKTRLMDAGFTIFYFAVNIGSFAGPLIIGYFGESQDWNIGFAAAGLAMLMSIVPILLLENSEIELITDQTTSRRKRITYISIVLVLVGLFWAIYELGSIRIHDLQTQLSEISSLDIPRSMWLSINSIFVIPLSLIAIIVWTLFYSSQLFKLMMGFVFGAISFGILFLIPEYPAEQHIIIFLLSLFLLNMSEVFLLPVIPSILTQYANPKYLAILVSVAFLPTRLFSSIILLVSSDLHEYPRAVIPIVLIAMIIISLGLIVYNRINKTSVSTG